MISLSRLLITAAPQQSTDCNEELRQLQQDNAAETPDPDRTQQALANLLIKLYARMPDSNFKTPIAGWLINGQPHIDKNVLLVNISDMMINAGITIEEDIKNALEAARKILVPLEQLILQRAAQNYLRGYDQYVIINNYYPPATPCLTTRILKAAVSDDGSSTDVINSVAEHAMTDDLRDLALTHPRMNRMTTAIVVQFALTPKAQEAALAHSLADDNTTHKMAQYAFNDDLRKLAIMHPEANLGTVCIAIEHALTDELQKFAFTYFNMNNHLARYAMAQYARTAELQQWALYPSLADAQRENGRINWFSTGVVDEFAHETPCLVAEYARTAELQNMALTHPKANKYTTYAVASNPKSFELMIAALTSPHADAETAATAIAWINARANSQTNITSVLTAFLEQSSDTPAQRAIIRTLWDALHNLNPENACLRN